MDDTDRITSFSSQAADLGDMLYTANRDIKRLIAERNYAKTLKDAAVAQLAIARQERDAARAERDALWIWRISASDASRYNAP